MGVAQLAVFVRPPESGEVKTRLTSQFGVDGAAKLYQAFVEDLLTLCARVQDAGRVDVTLWSAGDTEQVERWAARIGTQPRLQPQGDLGVRLATAFAEGLRAYERVVVIGSDLPTLPIELVGAAFAALEQSRLALGPSPDGGYYAIGATGAPPRLEGVRWSTSSAFDDTVAANAPLRPAVLAPWLSASSG